MGIHVWSAINLAIQTNISCNQEHFKGRELLDSMRDVLHQLRPVLDQKDVYLTIPLHNAVWGSITETRRSLIT